ncbi:MAG: quinone oxidoreductase [Chloroflexota bacterium]|nr:quinone oxidoreductase [Chloroflexota bacterium]MDE2885029.1 quinone oxidoreductase [Chloroflexota bacterium]
MKAVRFHEFGGPEVLRYEEIPEPEPGPGEVVLRLGACGVNFIDTYERSGAYNVPLPWVAGQEGAGEIVAVGAGVTDVAVGQRGSYSQIRSSYAEFVRVPAHRLVKLPDGVDYLTAAAVTVQGMTAHYLVTSLFPLEPGHTCLVHAAAGGVGLLLTQMAKMRGARVIGTVSTEEKARLAREAGADEVIIYTEQNFVEEVRRITGGEGLHVVYDSVGKDTFDSSLDCLAPRGYMALYGQSSGRVPPMDPQTLNAKGSVFLTRPSLERYTRTREELDWRANDVFGWIAEGALQVRISGTFPLSEAAEAHRLIGGRLSTGKLLLVP